MKYKRTLIDKLISLYWKWHYRIVEPQQLKVARDISAGYQPPKVHILLPTRKRWNILESRALKSVLQQTYANWELIIVHDGIMDAWTQVNVFAPLWHKYKDDTRIRFYEVDKKQHYPDMPEFHWLVGPSNALNFALDKVTNNHGYIARLDDDDEWHPNMLMTMVDFIEDSKAEFVSAYWMNEDRQLGKPYRHGDILVGGVQTWLYRSYLRVFRYNLNSWRKSWDKNNEIDLYMRMLDAGVKFAFLPEVVCTIRPRPSVSTIGLKGYLEEHER